MKPAWWQVDWKCWGIGAAVGPNEDGNFQIDVILGPVQALWCWGKER